MYQVGDLVHILPYEQMGRQYHLNSEGKMSPWYDTIATVTQVFDYAVRIAEDGGSWMWHYDNIEPARIIKLENINVDTLTDFL